MQETLPKHTLSQAGTHSNGEQAQVLMLGLPGSSSPSLSTDVGTGEILPLLLPVSSSHPSCAPGVSGFGILEMGQSC